MASTSTVSAAPGVAPEMLPANPPRRELPQDFWSLVWRRYKKNWSSVAALCVLGCMFLVALFHPMIVGTRPIVCKYKGNIYFPVMWYYTGTENPIFGISGDKFRGAFPANLAKKDPESWAIWPLVYQDPYRKVRDREWEGLTGGRWEGRPGTENNQPPNAYNLCGTDAFGRDVFARLVHGTPIALLVGFVSMGIATTIGLLVGSAAGYYGDERMRLTLPGILVIVLAIAFLSVRWGTGRTPEATGAPPGATASTAAATTPPSTEAATAIPAESENASTQLASQMSSAVGEPGTAQAATTEQQTADTSTPAPSQETSPGTLAWLHEAVFRSSGTLWMELFVFLGTLVAAAVLQGALKSFDSVPILSREIVTVPADLVLSRLMEVVLSIPALILILALIAIIPKPTIWDTMTIIGCTGWVTIARLVRGEFLKLRGMEFAVAANAIGASDSRIMFRHLLPNALAPVLVSVSFGIATAILIESGLSFLGFGVQPPTPSWGSVLRDGFQDLTQVWLIFFPGLCVFIAVFTYNLVGDGLQQAMDPRLKR